MKSLIHLLQEVLAEAGTWCRTSTTRDLRTITRRCEHEGLSFLTITLPAFCSDFQKSLDQGAVAHDHFAGFSRSGGLPRFLGGFLALVFERGTGRLLAEPSIDAIAAIRQVTLLCSKIALECTPQRTEAAIDGFVQCEKEVRLGDAVRTEADYSAFERIANLVLASALQACEEDVYYSRLTPRHGPGATADGLLGNRKFDQREWPVRLEAEFPSLEYLLPSARYYDKLAEVSFLEPGAERPVKVITVPKTLKTPRVIAVEPTCMQYVQQALMESLVGKLESDNTARHFLGFTDQAPNQRLAREGSLTGRLATIDLSEASDRVSNQLVQRLFRRYPNLARGVQASRSRKADVRGQTIRLAKFASMGSALCFPVEAMVFLAVVLLGIERGLNRPLTRGDIKSLRGQVRVYGDDIIVPVEHVHRVVSTLETFGFRVNAGKSFWTGKFRESCGREYYDGHDVSSVRVRDLLPTQPDSSLKTVHAISLRNRFYFGGWWGVARAMDGWLGGGEIPYPTVHPTSPVQGRQTLLDYQVERTCPVLQRPLVKGIVVRTTTPDSRLDDVGALMKWFLKRGEDPFARDHLARYGRPRAVGTKLRWAVPY